MFAQLHAKPSHALPRVRRRGHAWPARAGCKSASRKISSLSRSCAHDGRALAQAAPRQNALFLIASVSGSTIFSYVEGNPLSYTDPMGLMGQGSGRGNYLPGQGPGQGIGGFVSGLGSAFYNTMNRIDNLPRPEMGIPRTGQCVTAECAAGLLPTKPENRTTEQVEYGQCKLVCTIATAAPVGICNAVFGGGLLGTAAGMAGRAGFCSMVCK
jgi:hypothetical protein